LRVEFIREAIERRNAVTGRASDATGGRILPAPLFKSFVDDVVGRRLKG
jgi:hypothetical protein